MGNKDIQADGVAKGTITYTYDAAGNKPSKAVLENSVTVNYNGTNKPAMSQQQQPA